MGRQIWAIHRMHYIIDLKHRKRRYFVDIRCSTRRHDQLGITLELQVLDWPRKST